MRFCDTLLRTTTLSAAEKHLIATSQRIVADNVAAYYFHGTDQEYWSIATDFPNVAPPFEQCFIECRAPHQIVSQVYEVDPLLGRTQTWKLSQGRFIKSVKRCSSSVHIDCIRQ